MKPFPTPTARFKNLHIDIVGPLDVYKGYRFLLTIVDRFTRLTAAFPIKDYEASTCARTLYQNWICHYGVPATIVSDNGTNFTSTLWQALNKYLGIQSKRCTTYHPQCNGMVERYHRTLKQALKAHCEKFKNWPEILPSIVLGFKNQIRDDIRGSPAQLTFGEQLTLPGDFVPESGELVPDETFLQNMLKFFEKATPFPVAQARKVKVNVSPKLKSCKQVWIEKIVEGPLKAPYDGPFEVIEKYDKHFVVNVNGKHQKISMDRLKAVTSTS